MSYYHYFKLKKDSFYDKLSVDEIKQRMKSSSNFYTRGEKSILKASMVNWYYEENPNLSDRRIKIINYLIGIQCSTVHNKEYEWTLECKEDKYGLCRNRPLSEYDMQDKIDNWNDYLENIVGELLILSCVKFEPDDKYSDTPKTTSEYLRYEYQNEIDRIMLDFEEEAYDYEFAKFCINNCTRKTEDELSDEEITENETN